MRSLLKSLFVCVMIAFSAATFAQAIDINTATAAQLDKGLKGIGPKKAAEIVKYREANGPFKSVDDLAKVPGIKGKTLDGIRPLVTVGGAASAAPAMPAKPAPAAPAMPAKPTMPAAPAMPAKPMMPAPPTAPPTAPKQ
jgi:competence protein ComEA